MLAFWRGFDCDNHVTTEQVTKGNESLSKGRHLVFLRIRAEGNVLFQISFFVVIVFTPNNI